MRKAPNPEQKFTPFWRHLIMFTSMHVAFVNIIFVMAQKPHDN